MPLPLYFVGLLTPLFASLQSYPSHLQNKSDVLEVSPVADDAFAWNVILVPGEKSLYSGGCFHLNVKFPAQFPFKPPEVTFATRIYHCNVNDKGGICIDILKDQWTPALTMAKVFDALLELLDKPNPDSPLVAEIAKQYQSDKAKHDETAREWVKKYAQ